LKRGAAGGLLHFLIPRQSLIQIKVLRAMLQKAGGQTSRDGMKNCKWLVEDLTGQFNNSRIIDVYY
jgi:hypothetical protein